MRTPRPDRPADRPVPADPPAAGRRRAGLPTAGLLSMLLCACAVTGGPSGADRDAPGLAAQRAAERAQADAALASARAEADAARAEVQRLDSALQDLRSSDGRLP